MSESILISTKEKLGIPREHTHFDSQIITCINTVFTILFQLGIGPDSGFRIVDDTSIWTDFLGEEQSLLLGMVRDYVPLRVRTIFDPPNSSTVSEAIKSNIAEMEWRMREMKEIFMS